MMEPERRGDDAAAADTSMISNNSPYQPTTTPVAHRQPICAGLILDTQYVKSIQGLLKLVETLLCIIVLICLGTATCNDACSGLSFLRVVSIGSLIITIILFTVFALTLNTKIQIIHWSFTDLINASVDSVLYLIASSVLASQSSSPGDKAGIVFGFINAILYGVSTWVAYRAFVVERHKRKSHVPRTAGVADDA